MTPPLILLTNDDGIDSRGLHAAAEAVSRLGDLVIVAPSTQQTGMGRSMPATSVGRIQATQISTAMGPIPAYAVDGSPAQAVLAALMVILARQPSLVISGINYGENLGTCVTSSGTVGAALQAADFRIPALAVSLETVKSNHYSNATPVDWTVAALTTQRFAALLLNKELPFDVDVLKIDVPENATRDTPWRITRQSKQPYYKNFPTAGADRSRMVADFDYGVEIDWETLEGGSDIDAFARERIISVTPLSLDMTSRADLAELDSLLRRGVLEMAAGLPRPLERADE